MKVDLIMWASQSSLFEAYKIVKKLYFKNYKIK